MEDFGFYPRSMLNQSENLLVGCVLSEVDDVTALAGESKDDVHRKDKRQLQVKLQVMWL